VKTYEVVEDLIADDACHFEALFVRYRVDDQVPMDADKMLRVEDAILVLEARLRQRRRPSKSSLGSRNAYSRTQRWFCLLEK
jgi:hypothetical protein